MIFIKRMLENKEQISADKILEHYLGKGDFQKSLLFMLDEHNERLGKLVGKDYSFRTLQRYKTTRKHLEDFIVKIYKIKDYPIRNIDTRFINSFIYFLKSERNISHNSALKYLAYFKKIVRMAVSNGWLEKDPFYNFKLKPQVIDREYLTIDEITKLMEKEFSIPRIEHVRDVFLFCCYTGLAYADVEKLTGDEIIKGIDGNLWIKIKRTKTKFLSSIPLLPIAQKLIGKYENVKCHSNRLFPVYTNQRRNSYLKEIGDRCDINKNLTFHMARHTFATTVTLSNGVPIESVSKMLGHRSLKTTQHYAKILDVKLSEDMNTLKERILKREINLKRRSK